jgi:hypothetical protein
MLKYAHFSIYGHEATKKPPRDQLRLRAQVRVLPTAVPGSRARVVKGID